MENEKSIYLARDGGAVAGNEQAYLCLFIEPPIYNYDIFGADSSCKILNGEFVDNNFAHIKNGKCVEYVPKSQLEKLEAENAELKAKLDGVKLQLRRNLPEHILLSELVKITE